MAPPERLRLTPSEFAAKWSGTTRTERAAAQEHFIDLCWMLGVPTPNEADPHGDWYAFEKGAEKVGGGDGFADVWKRQHFAWEYKGKRKDLQAAYDQLLQYREALENPPLLVVCDLDRFEVHTNYTNTKKHIFEFTLRDLQNRPQESIRILKAVMSDPEALRPNQTPAQVTEAAAASFADLAGRLQSRGNEPLGVAHFLNKLLFCLFAEDVGLLPKGLFTRLVDAFQRTPEAFDRQLGELFSMMARNGGEFGVETVHWFNGGLFEDAATIPLDSSDLAILGAAAKLDWSSIEPSILGTLFERGLDPAKRGQLGAHYTDRDSIMRVVVPVVIEPLRSEMEEMQQEVLATKATGRPERARGRGARAVPAGTTRFRAFLERLRGVTVMDPACGSGNFLYVTLQLLKDLEKEAILWGAETLGISQEFPGVGPHNVRGIELSAYASELAKTTIWIGQIQWMVGNGFGFPTHPVLQPLQSVECRDAVLDRATPGRPQRASWPEAEFIVGNPPFIGGKKLRESLGDAYVDALFEVWGGDVPKEADFVCYWHEMARAMIASRRSRRAGLLATQGIRGGANQQVLKHIKETGNIFEAWQDEPWVVDGAAVHTSIVCQDDGTERNRRLDGHAVAAIHADLSGGSLESVNLTLARRLPENTGMSFMGDTKGGAFDISGDIAREMLITGGNPSGRPNSDVIVPWVNSLDVTRRPRDMFIVDFGANMSEREAAQYERPFEWIRERVRPERIANKRASYAERWWRHVEPRPQLRAAVSALSRFLVTPTVAKHRLFAWLSAPTLPDHQLIVIAREDDYAFGVLHSRAHEAWALRKGSQLRIDPRYTPTSTFETFPFPWPLNQPLGQLSDEQRNHHERISRAARELNAARETSLNPAEFIREEPDVVPSLPARRIPQTDEAAAELKKRTLTKLYNQRPAWLAHLHEDLDSAVLTAYGWTDQPDEDTLLARLLALNLARA